MEDERARRSVPEAGMPLSAFLAHYIERRKREWAPSMANHEPAQFERHVIPHIGDVPLCDLRRRHIVHLHSELAAKGLSPATISKVHRLLHRALKDAVTLELIPANPATGVSRPRVPKAKIAAPTDGELDAILDAIDEPWFLTLIRLDAITGSRRGELSALRWPDFDLDAGQVVVARAFSNGADGWVERQTKTDHVHPIALDDETVAELRAHRRRRLEWCLAAGARMDESGFVFVLPEHPVGDVPCTPDSISYRFAKACR